MEACFLFKAPCTARKGRKQDEETMNFREQILQYHCCMNHE